MQSTWYSNATWCLTDCAFQAEHEAEKLRVEESRIQAEAEAARRAAHNSQSAALRQKADKEKRAEELRLQEDRDGVAAWRRDREEHMQRFASQQETLLHVGASFTSCHTDDALECTAAQIDDPERAPSCC